MSENGYIDVKAGDTARSSPQGRSPLNTIEHQAWYEELYHPPVNDLFGDKCRVQPQPGQIPYLESGKLTQGCDYQSFSKTEIPRLYQAEKATSVYIIEEERAPHAKKSNFYNGSGVIVGKRNESELLILTDNHVVGEGPGKNFVGANIRTPDGIWHASKVVNRDARHDLALLSIKMAPQDLSKFEVATAVQSLSSIKPGDKTLGIGYPWDSDYLYASPGSVIKTAPMDKLTDCDKKVCKYEDWKRPVVDVKMHVLHGNSGGGIWNYKAELIGLLHGVAETTIKHAMVTPVTQAQIDNMIKRAKA